MSPIDTDTATTLLKEGSVGVLATDTVYGLVCSAHIESAVQRLYELKSREAKPGTLVAANIEQLVDLGIPKRYVSAVAHYWPNPISIVLPVGAALSYLHQGTQSLAVRIPSHDQFRQLLEQTGPLLTSSANQPGEPPAVNLAEAKGYFGNTVDFYLDGGDVSASLPSTIIRVVDDAVEVLREGAVRLSEAGEIIR